MFVIGFGFGPMIWSPLSEMPSVGRLRVYFWTALAFIVAQLVIPLSNSIEVIMVCRFLTGFLCSPVLAVGGGTVADMFGPATIGYPMAVSLSWIDFVLSRLQYIKTMSSNTC